MRLRFRIILASLILLLCHKSDVKAQDEIKNQENIKLKRYDFLHEQFRTICGENIRFLNGRLHTFIYPDCYGHPFFEHKNWMNASITTSDNEKFNNLSLKYDILTDGLLYNHYTKEGPRSILLNQHEIKSFEISGKNFINISNYYPALNNGELKGYFEICHSGHTLMLVKWTKNASNASITSRGNYVVNKQYYVINNNNLYHVTSRWKLLDALGDKSSEIKSYMKKKSISVRLGGEIALKTVLVYYDSLQ
jgi:hypothetical protein